jgi:hypothetical protein
MENNPRFNESWEKFLNPLILKRNLTRASVFIAAYELLKSTVIERVKSFFTADYRDGEWIVGPKYKERVRVLNDRDELDACMKWLVEMEAISEKDLKVFGEIRAHRNKVAHELVKFISSADHDVNSELFDALIKMTAAIERWWIREVEIPTNPDYDGIDPYSIDDSDINGGITIMLSIIASVFYEDDAQLDTLYQFWKDIAKSKK